MDQAWIDKQILSIQALESTILEKRADFSRMPPKKKRWKQARFLAKQEIEKYENRLQCVKNEVIRELTGERLLRSIDQDYRELVIPEEVVY